MIPYWRVYLFIVSLSFLSGCISFSPDGGFEEVSESVEQRDEPKPVWLRTPMEMLEHHAMVQSLLAAPLCADDAVRIALINNPQLQANLAELGISEANLVQAGRFPNPIFSYQRLTPVTEEYNIERQIIFDVLGMLTLPLKVSIEKRHFEQAKLEATIAILQTAALTRKAYYNAIASAQRVAYLKDVLDAAHASAMLARKMAEVGNFSRLEQMREQIFYAQMMAELAQTEKKATHDREELTRMMGLWGEQLCFILPDRLPDLPCELEDGLELEQEALCQRLDLQWMKINIESKAKALGLTKTTRFINVFDFGYVNNTGVDLPHQRGYQLSLEVPLFDWGGAKVAKAENIYMQAVWQLRHLAIQTRSEVREFYQNYRLAYDIAKHYSEEIIPLRKHILDESLLRYNGMLIGPFELINDKIQQIISVDNYIEKLLDFWIADIDLHTTLMVKSPYPLKQD